MARSQVVFAGYGLIFTLEDVEFVCDVKRCQDGQAQGIDRCGLLGKLAHLAVNIFSQLENVLGIDAAQAVGLIVNLDSDAVAVGLGHCRFGHRASTAAATCRTRALCFDYASDSAEVNASICLSIFSIRVRTSSRSFRSETTSVRMVWICSSRSDTCCRSRSMVRSAVARASRAAFSCSMVR